MTYGLVHMAKADSVLTECGMSHVAMSPLLGDVTCPECADLAAKRLLAVRQYWIEKKIGGEWTLWSAAPMTRDQCDTLILQMVRTADHDTIEGDIDHWRTVRL
jgi:hypothetical protein